MTTTLEDLMRLAKALDESSFVDRFPRHALVLSLGGASFETPIDTPSTGAPTQGALERKGRFEKKTSVMKPLVALDETHADEGPTPRLPVEARRDVEPDAAKCEVAFLEKSDRNPFSRMITIGRAANNDLILDHPSVSKVHAYFTSSQESGWMLNDQKSTNGTFVAGNPLPRGGSAPLSSGAVIRFGSLVRARFFAPPDLFRFLVGGSR